MAAGAGPRALWRGAASLYLALTYATLGVMPAVWRAINGFFGGKGIILLYAIYSLAALSLAGYMVLVKKERSPLSYLLFSVFNAALMVMFVLERNPGEKIHMAQYGVFGAILYKALSLDYDRFGWRLYAIGSVICAVAGAIDELIQWALPNRYFTLQDVFINGLSGMLVLMAIRFNILQRPTPKASESE